MGCASYIFRTGALGEARKKENADRRFLSVDVTNRAGRAAGK
jgi:hypothetical protein